jgi:hypothetical protein
MAIYFIAICDQAGTADKVSYMVLLVWQHDTAFVHSIFARQARVRICKTHRPCMLVAASRSATRADV